MKLLVDIHKKYKDFSLNVSFETSNEILGILGASGSGKSMTLRCIAGLETPTKGLIQLGDRILFDSNKGINMPIQERKVGFLFQNYALFPHMTVLENITFPLMKLSKKEQLIKAHEQIKNMKLDGLEQRYPCQISGGQQQRVAMARALVADPDVLLMDEPFSALDHHLRYQMEQQLSQTLPAFRGIPLFVSHHLDEVYRICDPLMVFDQGEIIANGNKEQIFLKPPNLQTAKITGCKNLSPIQILSEFSLYAVDWGYKINLESPIPPNSKYIGIRAHNIALATDNDIDNVYTCQVIATSKAPFQVTLSLLPIGAVPSIRPLQWIVNYEKWTELKSLGNEIRIKLNQFFLTSS